MRVLPMQLRQEADRTGRKAPRLGGGGGGGAGGRFYPGMFGDEEDGGGGGGRRSRAALQGLARSASRAAPLGLARSASRAGGSRASLGASNSRYACCQLARLEMRRASAGSLTSRRPNPY